MSAELLRLSELTVAHLRLSVWALTLGAALSVPLGIAASRRPLLERAVLGAASVIQTIPGLALLAFMVPALAALGAAGLELPSIGALPATLGLTLYSLLPMLRNTVVGLREVDASVRRAARGVGMTPRQSLTQVELPLAAPVIVAGLRTAAVWTVGMATLATPVGASSLGDLIFAGLQTRDHGAVLLGCLGSAGLALGLDGLVRAVEAGVRRRRRGLWIPAAALLAVIGVYSLGAPAWGALRADPSRDSIRIGAKPFTEQYVLARILALSARGAAERPVTVLPSLGSNVAFDALSAGDLDLYVEYTGTIWTALMGRGDPPADPRVLERRIDAWLRERGVVPVARLGFENAYALAIRSPTSGGPDIERLSELAPHAPRMRMAADYELFERGEWRSLTRTYFLRFAERRTMDPTLLYRALSAGEVDVIGAYTTDGRIAAFDLRVLRDDRGAIPPYEALILASRRLAARRPEVLEALRRLRGAIDEATMRELNRAVDVDGERPSVVAERWWRSRVAR